MKELLCGIGIENAFEGLAIRATRLYGGNPEKCRYEVWQVSDEGFARLASVPDKSWRDEWSWWRYANGCNMDDMLIAEIIVNGQPMKGWKDQSNSEDDLYGGVYPDLLTYLSTEIGASMEKNVCALCTDLAKMNGITMGELFQKYQ